MKKASFSPVSTLLLIVFCLLINVTFAGNNTIEVISSSVNIQLEIEVAPNPFMEELKISGMPKGGKTIGVFTEMGHLVQAYWSHSTEYKINEELAPGVYVIKIDSGDEEIFKARVFKSK